MGFVADAVDDVVDAVGEAVGDVVDAVGDVVSGVVDAVTDVISDAVSAVADVVSDIGVMNIIAVGIGVSMIPGVGAALSSALSSMTGLTSSTISTISSTISSFTSAIHLKTIMSIHHIAFILSEDYRSAIMSITDDIAEMSNAILGDHEYMMLALNNARSIVLDVQGIMGREFDAGQVAWLRNMSNFLGKWKTKLRENRELIDRYRENPALIFTDLDEHIIKPQIDLLGQSQQGLWGSLDSAVSTIDKTVTDLNTLRGDVNRFVRDLPGDIKNDILPVIDDVNSRIDSFLSEKYYPWRDNTNDILAILQNKEKTHKRRIEDIIGRMKYPGNVLADIDHLPPDERWDQANKVQNTANIVAQEQSEALAGEAEELEKELERIEEALDAPTKAPEVLRKEPEAPAPLPGRESKKPDTWFVGDY